MFAHRCLSCTIYCLSYSAHLHRDGNVCIYTRQSVGKCRGSGAVYLSQNRFLNARPCAFIFVRGVGAWQVLRPACHPVDWWHLSNDKNKFACMAPGCYYSYSIKPANKPGVCFPADKVIAIDLGAARVTIMKSVCCRSMNVEQEDEQLLCQWNKFGIDH